MAEGDLAQIQFVVGSIENFQTSFGFRSTSDVADWRAILLEGFVALVAPIMIAAVSSDLTVIEVRCVDVWPGTGVDEVWVPPVPTQGGQAGRPVSPQIAAKLQWLTAERGRSKRGSSYLAGLPFAWMADDPNEWGVPWDSYADELGSTMLMAYGPEGTSTFGRFVIISRWENGVLREPPIGTQVSDWKRVTPARTQRRRQHA